MVAAAAPFGFPNAAARAPPGLDHLRRIVEAVHGMVMRAVERAYR